MKLRLLPVVFALVVPLAACSGNSTANPEKNNSAQPQKVDNSPSSQTSTSPNTQSSAAPSANSSPNSNAVSSEPFSYTSPDGNYTAKFPGKPSEQPRSTDSPQGKVTGAEVRYVDQAKQQLYLTGHVNLPIAPGNKLNDANIQQILTNGRDSMVKTSGATVKNEKQISQNGFPGKEFVMSLPNGTAVKARIYINPNNKRAYQVIVAAKDGKVDSTEVNTFMDSMVIAK